MISTSSTKNETEVKSFQISEFNSAASEKNKAKIVKNYLLDESKDKIIQKINIHKQTSLMEYDKKNEYALFSNNEDKSDSLFDKVLSQVKERNKDRRKKSITKIEEVEIHLGSNKPNEKSPSKFVEIRTKEKAGSIKQQNMPKFDMLKEMDKVNGSLDEHLEQQNKNIYKLKSKKEEFTKVLEQNNKGICFY